MTDTVYLAANGKGGRARKYHLDEDCVNLAKARTTVAKDRALVEDHKDVCKRCAGVVSIPDRDRYRQNGFIETLEQMDPEEVGL